MNDNAVTPGWKFLLAGMRSQNGRVTWKLDKWRSIKGDLVLCQNGFHLSDTPLAAFGYVKGEIIAHVEGRGENAQDTDKSVWREMRVVKAWRWRPTDSVALAIYAAEKVLAVYEVKYLKDDRPRKAIEAAKAYLKNPDAAARAAAANAAARAAARAANAAAADAARAADAAAYAAADAAARAADAAAYAADAAARAADAAAYAAADAAARAAAANAAAAFYRDCNLWIVRRTRTLEAIK